MNANLTADEIIESLKRKELKFKTLSVKQRNNPDIAIIGALLDYGNLKYIKDEIKGDYTFASYCMQSSGYSMKYMPRHIINDIDLAKIAVKTSPFSFTYLGDEARNCKEVAMIAVKNGCSLAMMMNLYTDDEEIIEEAVRKNGFSLEYASDRLKNNRNIVLSAVISQPEAIKFASEHFKSLCEGKEPIIAIKSEIAKEEADKLRIELDQTSENKIKKMKL